MKHVLLLAATALALLAFVGPASGAGTSVRVSDDRFSAKTVTVNRGDTVTWRFVGSDGHNVVGNGFKSKVKSKGAFRKTFTRSGRYSYVCTLHADDGMKGTVVVR
jgi:plastocyanin